MVTASGSSLSKGADLIVNGGTTWDLAVSALSSSAAVVCYEQDSNSDKGVYERLCV